MLTNAWRAEPPNQDGSEAGTPSRAGSDDVLRMLYAEHGRAVLSDAKRFTADRGRAEDVVQETFLRGWRQLPGLIDGVSVEPAVDGGLDHLLDQSMIVDALRRLSPAHQQIVIETFFVGRPMQLTAARRGVPAATARSRLHYALGQLRRQLESSVRAA